MIAITGGAGFLGYHLADYLHDRDATTVLLDIADFDESEYPATARFVNVDIRDFDGVRDALKHRRVDCIIHAAAALPLWKRREIFSTNIQGTQTVLAVAADLDISRVVVVSSTAVYGIPEIHPIYEHHQRVGVGPYGESKVEAEKVCERARETGICIPIVRPKTFIGTGRLGVFQILYDWVESGCKIPVIGPGTNRYQLLEVEDLCSAIWLCVTAPPDQANDTFNVGAEDFGTVRHDVGALCDYADSGARVMGTPAWLVKPALKLFEMLRLSPLYEWVYGTADTDSYVAVEKIKDRLGWQAEFSNAEALIRSYQWYLDNKDRADETTGLTHRKAWNQGILKLFKRLLG